jgi:predicted RNA-binding Zn-ribbon protein involved in translation (DUF1610 family)
MAEFKNCPVCETSISESAYALHDKSRYGAMLCPNCGKRIRRGKSTVVTSMFIFGLIILVLAVVGWASTGWAGL